ncbi:MAG: Ig-like domain-containing protein [Parasphingorhabdus sp.]|uniref:Ig-like domain-containing protein n=1 Tax=Parasphingorhabdus sp. TaxID=2709688 RepID=UPI0032987A3C
MDFAGFVMRGIAKCRSHQVDRSNADRSWPLISFIAIASLAAGSSAFATETTTYEYDAQGRLIKSSKTGGPSNGKKKCTSYDPAGNRTNQTVTSASCTGGTGGGGGGGGGSNNPPVAVNDFMVTFCGAGGVNVLTNDSDPDGDTITAISVTGGMGATISGGNTVVVTAGSTGTLTYTIQDTSGATATATISVFEDCGFF